MSESYTVLINSAEALSNNNPAAPNTSLNYFFDWSILPENKYLVHFTYLGEINDLSGGTDIAMVYLNFGCGSNNFAIDSNIYGAQTSTFLGLLRPERLVASSFLYAEDSTNTPIFIKSRPTNNNFTVNVYSNVSDPTYFTPTTGNLAPYVIQLRFIPYSNSE